MAQSTDLNGAEEWETEEEDVYVELHGLVDPSQLYKCTVENSRVLGIDTERPIFKLDNNTYAGNYQDTLGTAVLFNVKEKSSSGKSGRKALEYFGHTTTSISTNRVMVYPRKGGDPDVANSEGTIPVAEEEARGIKVDAVESSEVGTMKPRSNSM